MPDINLFNPKHIMILTTFHDEWHLSKMSDVISPDALKMEAGALMPAILTQSVHENLLSAPGSPIADLSSDIQVAYFYSFSGMFGASNVLPGYKLQPHYGNHFFFIAWPIGQ